MKKLYFVLLTLIVISCNKESENSNNNQNNETSFECEVENSTDQELQEMNCSMRALEQTPNPSTEF